MTNNMEKQPQNNERLDEIVPTETVEKPVENEAEKKLESTPINKIESLLFGKPLASQDMEHQTIGKAIGLAVFASDALSSMAYSTQEMMIVLAAAGTAAFGYIMPLTLMIVGLLIVLTISYEQTIHAYPSGGGAYIVARDNLGDVPAMTAAAALLTDYILTVAVSISSGVAQFTSVFPNLYPYRVILAVSFVLLVMMINLRGVKESGITFAIPTYVFLFAMTAMVIVGFIRYFSGTLGTVVNPPRLEHDGPLQPITLFLILKAFATGTTALTGVEAISNGITAFKEPRSRNAGQTLILMSVILGTLLLGVSFLTYQTHVIPSEHEANIAQLARTIYGSKNIFYLITVGATMIILIMAANTAFADYPRLSALLAKDGFLPRRFSWRGSRLVFSYGITFLAFVAIALIIIAQASVNRLIPLYAVGVFFSFTLSQYGMAKRWHRCGKIAEGESIDSHGQKLVYDPKWFWKMLINGAGALCSAMIALIFAVTKFTSGAWFVLILTPILVILFSSIKQHYSDVARKLSLKKGEQRTVQIHKNHVVLLLSGVHQSSMKAYYYAQTITDRFDVVHVAIDPEQTDKVQAGWEKWGNGSPLTVLPSPYRLLIDPLYFYLERCVKELGPDEVITVIVPQFVSNRPGGSILHEHAADALRKALIKFPKIVITEVPFNLDEIQ